MSQQRKPIRVLELIPSRDHAHKPFELIQIRGHAGLTLNARRTITVLWHNAHLQGIEDHKDYTIELDKLVPSKHRGHEQVVEAIEALMTTLLIIRSADGGESRMQLLGGNDLYSKDRAKGRLTYSFDKRLVPLLRDSRIWGRIPLVPMMQLGSKYSVPLYEHLSQWAGLHGKTHETFSLEEFRSLLGVEDSKYQTFGHLNDQVLKPVAQEINETAPFGVRITPKKTGRSVTHIRLDWWQKTSESVDKSGENLVDE